VFVFVIVCAFVGMHGVLEYLNIELLYLSSILASVK